MATWKVLVVMLFAIICLGLGLATIVVPLTLKGNEYQWVWFGGLLFGTIVMGTLFTLSLRSADKSYKR